MGVTMTIPSLKNFFMFSPSYTIHMRRHLLLGGNTEMCFDSTFI